MKKFLMCSIVWGVIFSSFSFGKEHFLFNNIISVSENGQYFYLIKDNNKQIKVEGVPLWLFHKTILPSGKIIANGFNGINFTGIVSIDLSSGEISTIDLLKIGLPTNYISDIQYYKNNLVLIDILGEYHLLNLDNKRIESINFLKGKNRKNFKIHIENDSIYFFNENQIIGEHSKIFSAEYPIKKIIYINNKNIAYQTNDGLCVYSKKDSKSKIFPNIKQFSFYFMIGELSFYKFVNKLIMYDGNELTDVTDMFDNTLAYDKVNNLLLLNKKNDEKLSVIGFGDKQNEKIDKVDLYYFENFTEIKPYYNNNEPALIIFKSKENKSIYGYGKVLKVPNVINIENAAISVLTRDFKIKKTILQARTSNRYVSTKFADFFFIITMSIGIYVIFSNKYFFIPFIFSVILIFITVYLILGEYGLIIENGFSYTIASVTGIVAFVYINSFYHRIKNQEEIIHSLHLLGHGSEGINNILRIARLVSANGNSDSPEIRHMLTHSSIIFSRITSSNIKKILKDSIYDIQNLGNIILIDLSRVRTTIILKKNIKSRFSEISFKEKNRLNKNIETLLHYLENLKKNIYNKYSSLLLKTIKSVITNYKKDIEENNIQLLLPNENDIKVLCEYKDLFVIIDNLIKNSIETLCKESTNDIRRLSIQLTTDFNNVYLTICNSGKSLNLNDFDSALNMNYTTKPNGGTGLFTVKKILEKYYGSISITDETNYTCFKIKLRKL